MLNISPPAPTEEPYGTEEEEEEGSAWGSSDQTPRPIQNIWRENFEASPRPQPV
jgi:hypothetical protein